MIGIPIAAELGHVEIAETIIDHVINSNPRDIMKRTPLHYAAMNGHVDIVKILIPISKTLNSKDNFGKTPLNYASLNGHNNTVAAIVRQLSLIYIMTPLCSCSGMGGIKGSQFWSTG